MSSERDYTVNSILEYMDVLLKIRTAEKGKLWYRGQRLSSWHLDPTLYREVRCFEVTDRFGNSIVPIGKTYNYNAQEVLFPDQFSSLEFFKSEILKNELAPSPHMNDMEWLCFAQHCKMPTSLLDWSEDPMVGLFFALDGIALPISEADMEKEAIVYILNPSVYNETYSALVINTETGAKGPTGPWEIDDKNCSLFIDFIKQPYHPPICIKPRKIGYRMCRQSGNFLLYSAQIKPLDSYPPEMLNQVMYRIHIPYTMVEKIKAYFTALNLNKESIYGDNEKIDDAGEKAKENSDKRIKDIVDEIKATIK